jgi:SAM-dependent methyltransferase
MDWYCHPEYYEAIFGPDSPKEMDFLCAVGERHGTGGPLFLEPACGSGRLLQEGAKRGLQMVGYDASWAMLEYARERLTPKQSKHVRLHEARMETFSPRALKRKVDLAYNLVSSFRYLSSEAAALSHLVATRGLLKPGGVYVLGFHLTDYSRKGFEHERWVGKVKRDMVVCNTREWPPEKSPRRSRMRNRLQIQGPKKNWVIETDWFFRTYDIAQMKRLIRKAGFELQALYNFDYKLDEPMSEDTDRLDWVLVLKP